MRRIQQRQEDQQQQLFSTCTGTTRTAQQPPPSVVTTMATAKIQQQQRRRYLQRGDTLHVRVRHNSNRPVPVALLCLFVLIVSASMGDCTSSSSTCGGYPPQQLLLLHAESPVTAAAPHTTTTTCTSHNTTITTRCWDISPPEHNVLSSPTSLRSAQYGSDPMQNIPRVRKWVSRRVYSSRNSPRRLAHAAWRPTTGSMSIATSVRGGATPIRRNQKNTKPPRKPTKTKKNAVATKGQGRGGLFVAPSSQTQSILWMTLAMACHYLGYGIARSITVSLFTSEATGYHSNAATAVSLAMTLVSPVSIALLLAYTRVLQHYGPHTALLTSTIACASVMGCGSLAIAATATTTSNAAARYWTGPLFVFREAYVQLLTSQFWSFFASALTPRQAAQWFGPIASVTSCASALAGWGVGPLVRWCRDHTTRTTLWHHKGTGAATDTPASSLIHALLLGNVGMLVLSALAAHCAYSTWAPPEGASNKTKGRQVQKLASNSSSSNNNMFHKAMDLLQRVPVLKALLLEILTSQALSTLLNVCFVARVGTALPDDTARAAWLGRYYGGMNLLTLVLQGGILPLCFSRVEPRTVWRIIPLLPLVSTAWQVQDPSLRWVSLSLLVMKVTEYSARKLLDEMIFVPLDYESRYFGKEVLGVVGYRFGKSAMSLVLSAIAAVDSSFDVGKQSVVAHVAGWVWCATAWNLSSLVPTREEAEQAHRSQKQHTGKKK